MCFCEFHYFFWLKMPRPLGTGFRSKQIYQLWSLFMKFSKIFLAVAIVTASMASNSQTSGGTTGGSGQQKAGGTTTQTQATSSTGGQGQAKQ